MNNPNPVPCFDFVAYFMKSRGSISLSMPAPVSLTVTDTSLLWLFFSTVVVIIPYSVNLTALLRRFSIT
jgi:hypothetical protein